MTSSSDDDTLKRAINYSYRLLAIKDRSKAELRSKLLDKGFNTDMSDRVISHLTSNGYIDDQRLAARLVKKAINEKYYGIYAIRHYLLSKGIEEEVIEHIELKREDLIESALGLIKKRTKSYSHMEIPNRDKKLFQLLKRRGHDTNTIKEALANLRR